MKRFHKIIALLLSLTIVLTFTACKNSIGSLFDPDYPVTAGGVTLKNAPERVISLSATTTSILTLMGYSNRLVAIDNDYTGELDKPRAGTVLLPDEKLILEQSPDLVLTTAPLPDDILAKLKLRDIAVAVLPVPNSYANLADYYTTIATLFSGKKTGKDIANEYNQALAQNFQTIAEYLSGKTQVSSCIIIEKGFIATGKTFLGDVLSLAGGNNVAKNRNDYKITSAELTKLAPQVIFCPKALSAELIADKTLANVPAIKQNKVYEIDIVGLGTMGENFIDSVFTLTEKMYPDFSSGDEKVESK